MPEPTARRAAAYHPLVLVWGALIASPLLILLHQEVHFLGPQRGWQFATLEPGGFLYHWTRNRLLVWAALYALGAALLVLGLRRDPGAVEWERFTSSAAGRALVPFAAMLVLFGLVFLDPPELLLLGMGFAVAVIALWALTVSATAMASVAAPVALLGTSLIVVVGVGECTLRQPAMVAQTGGSLAARHALFEEVHAERQRESAERRALHARPAPEGAQRILALGDSFTWGEWVGDLADIWPTALENELRQRGIAVQVVNGGASGSDTSRHADHLRREGWLYSPDVIVIQHTLNDAGSPLDAQGTLVPLFGTPLRRSSALYLFLDTRLQALLRGRAPPSYDAFYADDRPGWRANREAMRDIVEQSSERGAHVFVLLFPMFHAELDDAQYPNLRSHAAIEAFVTEELRVPFLDLRPAFAAADPNPRSWWAQPFDSHPNAAAHRLAAGLLADHLQQAGFIGR